MGEIASTLSDKVIITKGTLNSETLEDINSQIISGIKNNNYEFKVNKYCPTFSSYYLGRW